MTKETKKTPKKSPKTGRKGADNVTPIGKKEKSPVQHVIGAKIISGENVVGIKSEQGIDNAMLIFTQPDNGPEGGNLRIILMPYRIPLFMKRPGALDISNKHIMDTYEIPAQLVDHYLQKQQEMGEQAKKEK